MTEQGPYRSMSPMATRRGVLALAAACVVPAPVLAAPVLAAPAALPVPKGDRLVFAVFRDGSRIGTEELRFERSGTLLTVVSHAALRVSVIGIPMFHYLAQITEHWSDGRFESANSVIDDSGTRHVVAVRRDGGRLAVSGNRIKAYAAPPDALPLTYWNKSMLNGPVINMQTGNTDYPAVTPMGWYTLPAAPSGTVTAEEFKLSGVLQLAVFYDRAGIWSGLDFRHRGAISLRPVKD